MSKKTLKISAITMLILNLGLITLLILGKPHHPKRPRDFIIEKLHLDDGQISQYEKLIEFHRSAMDKQHSLLRSKKDELYTLLSSDDLNSKDLIIDEIGEIQKVIENINFVHFEQIKEIVKSNKDQVNDFYALTNELGELFAPKRGPKKH